MLSNSGGPIETELDQKLIMLAIEFVDDCTGGSVVYSRILRLNNRAKWLKWPWEVMTLIVFLFSLVWTISRLCDGGEDILGIQIGDWMLLLCCCCC